MKVLDVRVGDSIAIDGGRIVIHVRDKSGQRARLAIEAGPDVSIRMEEGESPAAARPRKLTPVT